mgnify:CR=1 FL=1
MGHGHQHHHEETGGGRLGLAFALNTVFTVIELVGAWLTNSTAIAADALHDLGDSLALAFAWGMQGASNRRADGGFTYGYRRLSLAGAAVNAVVLLVGGMVVLSESIPRLLDPPTPNVQGMLGLAVLGVAVNGLAALRVGEGKSLNERVVRLHLLEDVFGWVAVLVVSLVMLVVELPVLDPLLCIGITLWVGWNAGRNLRSTLKLFLQGAPEDLDGPAICEEAADLPGVVGLEHVHLWSLDGQHHVLTADLVVEAMDLEAALELRERVAERLRGAGISHVTLALATDADGTNDCS